MSAAFDVVPFSPGASERLEGVWFKPAPKMRIVWALKSGIIAFILAMAFGFWGLMLFFTFYDDPVMMFLMALGTLVALVFTLGLAWATLFYNRYSFMIDSHGLHINRGVLWKRNADIPYERVQHVTVTRGPLEILFKLYSLNVFTAGTGSISGGMGGPGGMMAAEGHIPGLLEPELLKSIILAHVERKKGSGLGYDDSVSDSATSSLEGEMLEELRAIRRILEKR